MADDRVSAPRQLRCHRCRSAELILREARLEVAEYHGGLHIRADGRIEAVGEGFSNPGEILTGRTEIECEDCGHAWHPRRDFAGERHE